MGQDGGRPQPRVETAKRFWQRFKLLAWSAAVPASVWLTLWSGVAPPLCQAVNSWDLLPASVSPCGPSAEDLRLAEEAERLAGEAARLKAEAARNAAEQERLRQEQASLAQQRETLNALAASVGDLLKRQTTTPDGKPADPQTQAKAAEAITEIAEQAAGTDAAAETERALQLIKDGKADEGLAVLEGLAAKAVAAAEQTSVAAAEERAKAVAQWRRIGQLARPLSTVKALAAYEQVVALDRSNPWDSIYLGRLYVQAGNLPKAQETFEAALAQLPEGAERTRGVLAHELGVIERASGNLEIALRHYRAYLSASERLSDAEPDNTEWQRDLSVSHNKVGDVLRDQGDLAGALQAFRDSLAIAERLAADDPSHAGWQRDLSVSHNRIGDVLRDQGDLAGGLQAYRASLAIRERLAADDPSHAGWQRDLSVSHEKIGDVLRDQGDLAGALQAFRDSLAIRERLAADDPSHAGWQRDMIASYAKLGTVEPGVGWWAKAVAVAEEMVSKGILAPRDAWIPNYLRKKAAADQ